MADTIQNIQDILKKHSSSHPVLKDFQQAANIQKGDGVSDGKVDVFSVVSSDAATSSSRQLVIKQILDPEHKAGLLREYHGGLHVSATVPEHTDTPVCQDGDFLILESQPGYNVLWNEISASHVDKVGVQQLGLFLGRLHRALPPQDGSNVLSGDADVRDRLREVLFSNPYSADGDSGNAPPALRASASKLLENPEAKSALDALSSVLSNQRESFVHGNLSASNVTVKQGHPKFVNLGCSMVGPRGLDLGLLIASYIAQYHQHMLTAENNDAHRRVSYKMMDACTTTVNTYLDEMGTVLSDEDKKVLLSDTAGFAACELIRRSVGGEPYPGLENSPSVCTEMFESGMRLLNRYSSIDDIGRLMFIGLALC